MTVKTSNAFTVQITPFVNPYSGYLTGQVTQIVSGTPYNYGAVAGEPDPAILAFSGACVASSTGKLILFGGGDNDYAGNETWHLNIDNPLIGTSPPVAGAGLWTKHSPTSTWAHWVNGSLYGTDPTVTAEINDMNAHSDPIAYPGAWSDGRPISRHTYNSLRWLPTAGMMFAGGGSYYGGSGVGGVGGPLWSIYGLGMTDQWLYDPLGSTSSCWTFVGTGVYFPGWDGVAFVNGRPNVSSSPRAGMLIATPLGESATYGVVGFYNTGYPNSYLGGVGIFNPTAKTWTEVSGSAFPIVTDTFWCVYDSAHESVVAIVRYGGVVSAYEFLLANPGAGWVSHSIGGTPPYLAGVDYENVCYSTHSGDYLLVEPWDASLWKLRRSDWSWVKVKDNCFNGLTAYRNALGITWCPTRNVGFVAYNNISNAYNGPRLDVYAFRA